MSNENVVMTVPELAATLGVSIPVAYKLVHVPGFPKIVIGRRIILVREQVMRWIDDASSEEMRIY